jgi:hypothetical protein
LVEFEDWVNCFVDLFEWESKVDKVNNE